MKGGAKVRQFCRAMDEMLETLTPDKDVRRVVWEYGTIKIHSEERDVKYTIVIDTNQMHFDWTDTSDEVSQSIKRA